MFFSVRFMRFLQNAVSAIHAVDMEKRKMDESVKSIETKICDTI